MSPFANAKRGEVSNSSTIDSSNLTEYIVSSCKKLKCDLSAVNMFNEFHCCNNLTQCTIVLETIANKSYLCSLQS